jgi:hypothetical protein
MLMTVMIPSPVWACSVCFLAKKENLVAYFGAGVLLSVLPFLLIGGIGFWLYRQVKERSRSLDAMRAE